jgi:hypothetical protein
VASGAVAGKNGDAARPPRVTTTSKNSQGASAAEPEESVLCPISLVLPPLILLLPPLLPLLTLQSLLLPSAPAASNAGGALPSAVAAPASGTKHSQARSGAAHETVAAVAGRADYSVSKTSAPTTASKAKPCANKFYKMLKTRESEKE